MQPDHRGELQLLYRRDLKRQRGHGHAAADQAAAALHSHHVYSQKSHQHRVTQEALHRLQGHLYSVSSLTRPVRKISQRWTTF